MPPTRNPALKLLLQRHRTLILLSLCAAWIIAVRLKTYSEPLERDIAIYSLVADGWRHGQTLYRDIWEMKPPGVFPILAIFQALFGIGRPSILAFNLIFNLLALALIYAAGCRWGARRAGLWAAAFWTLLCGDIRLQANQPNLEVLMNTLLTGAFLASFSPGWVSAGMAGAAIGIAALVKPVAALPGMALLGIPPRRKSLLSIAVMGGIPLITAILFWGLGLWPDFYDTVVRYSVYYSQTSHRLAHWLQTLGVTLFSPETRRWLWVLMALTLMGKVAGGSLWRWAAWMVGTFFAIAAPGHAFAHYLQLWIPPLALGAGWGIAQGAIRMPRAARLTGVAAVLWLAFLQVDLWWLNVQDISRRKYQDRFVEAQKTAGELKQRLQANETFYNWGIDATLYVEADRKPPTGFFLNTPLLAGPLVEKQTARVLDDLDKAAPEMVVISKYEMIPGARAPRVEEWIRQHYHRLPDGGDRPNFLLLMRRGGALEKRLKA